MTRQSPYQYKLSILVREKVNAHFWMLSGWVNCPTRTWSSVFEKVAACANKEGGRTDFTVAVVSQMEVGTARQCIGFVLFIREMDEGEVVVSEARDVAHDLSVYVLRVTVVFKILVVSVDDHRVRGPHEEVAPVSEAAD